MFSKKRKIDNVNRKFQTAWIERYCSTMPVRNRAIPICLIYENTVAVSKCSNLKRPYEIMHKDFQKNFHLTVNRVKTSPTLYLLCYENSTITLFQSINLLSLIYKV